MVYTTIIIPTYGKRIEADNSLPALLDSIKQLKQRDFQVVILNNTVDRAYHNKIKTKINKIISNYKENFKIVQFTYQELDKLHEYFANSGYMDFKEYVHFSDYSAFRNIGLLVATIMNSTIVIFIDDDELIEDKDYLKKSREFIGGKYKGRFIGGIAGYYINEDGSHRLPEHDLEWWGLFWNKPKHMNKAFEIIDSKKRLNETTFAFGGNLVLHRKMFSRIPFDPYIHRGEDLDLLINAKYMGYAFLLDNKLGIKHLPPKKDHSDIWSEMRKDAYRFIYKRKKILDLVKDGKLKEGIISSLDPYPGYFIRKDIYLRLIITSFLLGLNVTLSGRFKDAFEHFRNIKISLVDANRHAIKNSRKYIHLQRRWFNLMLTISKDKYLKEYFNKKLG